MFCQPLVTSWKAPVRTQALLYRQTLGHGQSPGGAAAAGAASVDRDATVNPTQAAALTMARRSFLMCCAPFSWSAGEPTIRPAPGRFYPRVCAADYSAVRVCSEPRPSAVAAQP